MSNFRTLQIALALAACGSAFAQTVDERWRAAPPDTPAKTVPATLPPVPLPPIAQPPTAPVLPFTEIPPALPPVSLPAPSAPQPAVVPLQPMPATPIAPTKPDDKKAEEKKDDKAKKDEPKAEVPKEKKWYEKFNFRGYTQIRSNETVWQERGTAEATLVGDGAVGPNQNFSIRRARLILSSDLSEHLSVYFQPDLAITPPGSSDGTFFVQLRDWYGDVHLTTDKVHRLRVGLSKVPFGFENLQSSSNRLAFDRTDAINSPVSRNERDFGVFYYWTPEHYQQLFKRLVDDGLKGSGNYGIFGLGVYNGQGGAFLEQNDNLHAVARATYPIEFENGQILELSTQAYTGKFSVNSAPIRPLGVGNSFRPINTIETNGRGGLIDERVGWSAVWYPQPLGFQAEWNIGRGPGLTDQQTAVVVRDLHGGYIQTMYKIDTCRHGTVIPFVQWTYFRGGYRSQRNAPYVDINEWHFGCEWQISKALEFTVQYTQTDRTNTNPIDRAGAVSYGQFVGGLLRFQLQMNY